MNTVDLPFKERLDSSPPYDTQFCTVRYVLNVAVLCYNHTPLSLEGSLFPTAQALIINRT